MPLKLESLRVNPKIINDGDWVQIPELPGVRLHVRAWSYQPFVVARDAIQLKWERRYGKDTWARRVTTDDYVAAMGAALHEYILLNWEGIDQPYSTEIAQEHMTDHHSTLFGYVTWASQQLAQANIEFVDDAAKNSGPPSAMNSNGAAAQS